MEIKELKKKIEEQKKRNLELFNVIPLPTHEDPLNKKAEPILIEWRKGSETIKRMIKELCELERTLNKEVDVKEKTFINGFGEATKRNITCSVYERAEKRNEKAVLSFMGIK